MHLSLLTSGCMACLLALPAYAVNAESQARSSTRQQSRTVTAQMRENAVANVEKYPQGHAQKQVLLNRLKPYLEADLETLWKLLPSQAMPRSSIVTQSVVGMPASGENHAKAPRLASRGYGNKLRFHFDPFTHPWQIQDRADGEWYPKNDFAAYYESALDKQRRFQPGKGNSAYLQSTAGKETETWVDDGTGAKINGISYFFAAHYAYRIWAELIDVTRDLAELYTLTNDPAYAHRAAVILDRMADLYPEMDFMPSFKLGMECSSGVTGRGRVQGRIWETWTAQRLSLAYDQIFDALVRDEALVAFSQAQAEKYHLGDKSSPRKIAAHIEDRLIREFVRGIKDGNIHGNDGMHQYAMAAAAVALDDPRETPSLIDWISSPQGGALPSVLVDGMSRDGRGTEAGIGYSRIPADSFFNVAQLLDQYASADGGNFFDRYPKFANALSGGESIRLLDGAYPHWGDGGNAMRVGAYGLPMQTPLAWEGYVRYGKRENLLELWNSVQRKPGKIPLEIYRPDANSRREKAISEIQALKPEPFQSFNSGGVGLAALQAPSRTHPRMIAMNYGPMGFGAHGHGDRLAISLIAEGSYMMTDLGYPTTTGHPSAIGWTRHTVSHNTVMVNDQYMKRHSTFSGKTILFAEAGPLRVMDVDGSGERTLRGDGHSSRSSKAEPIYPDVRTYRRCVVMIDVDERHSYALDLFWIRGGHIHRLIQNGGGDEVIKSGGNWLPQGKGTAAGENIPYGEYYDGQMHYWDYNGSGLMFLTDVERSKPDSPFWIDWKIRDPFEARPKDYTAHLRVHHLSKIDEALLANGEVPSGGTQFTWPEKPYLRYLHRVVRGKDLETQFISLIEPYGSEPFIKESRLLKTRYRGEGFAAAVEVRFKDGRRDIILVTEEGGKLKAGKASLDGRIGWLRLDETDQVIQSSMIEGSQFSWRKHTLSAERPSFVGNISEIDESDPSNVIISTDCENLSEELIGRYLIVNNHQRADASYRILAVLPEGKLNIGRAALGEIHVDSQDYSKGIIRNIAVGDAVRISNITTGGTK